MFHKKKLFFSEENTYGICICPIDDYVMRIRSSFLDNDKIFKFYTLCDTCNRHYLYYYIKNGLVCEEIYKLEIMKLFNEKKIKI